MGVLHLRDTRLAHSLLELLRAEPGLVVGDNQPYAASDATDYSIVEHGERGHVLQQPVWQLLGAERPEPVVPYLTMYSGPSPLATTIRNTNELVDHARADGFRAAKIEALTDTTEDNDEIVELVRAVRAHAGPDFTLALDVGYRWPSADDALDCIRRLEEFDLFFIETPFMPELVDDYRRLAEDSPIAIAGAEILTSYAEYGPLLDAGIDIAQAGTCRVGITESDRLARRAARARAPLRALRLRVDAVLGRREHPGRGSQPERAARRARAGEVLPAHDHARRARRPRAERSGTARSSCRRRPASASSSTRTPSRATGSDGATTLRALGWDHPRCTAPMRACSEAWQRLHPEVELVWENRSLTAFGDEPLEEVAHRYDLAHDRPPVLRHRRDDRDAAAVRRPARARAARGARRRLDRPEPRLVLVPRPAVGARDRRRPARSRPCATTCSAAAALRRPGTTCERSPARARAASRSRSRPHRPCARSSRCARTRAAPRPRIPRGSSSRVSGSRRSSCSPSCTASGPPDALAWEQPDVLGRLASGDELVYVPLVFGFVTYARADRVPHPVPLPRHRLGGSRAGRRRSSAAPDSPCPRRARMPSEAAAFAAFASGAEAQRTLVGPVGWPAGQPHGLERTRARRASRTASSPARSRPSSRRGCARAIAGGRPSSSRAGRLLNAGLAARAPPTRCSRRSTRSTATVACGNRQRFHQEEPHA